MPIQGPQQPGFWLPDTEYFALAPNTNIALGGRRRITFRSPDTNVPAETDGVNLSAQQQLETAFQITSGIYLHFFYVSIGVTAAGTTLNNVISGLNLLGSLSPDYPLGNPIITTPSFFISTVLLSDREKLIAARDVHAADVAAGGVGQTTNLFLSTLLNINNPNPNALTAFIFGTIIYTRLDGLQE